jgi:hypothetical protein
MRESFLLCALLLSAPLTAQLQPAGTSLGTSTTTVTRGGVGNGTGELLQRFDADQLHGFGADAAHPGFQVVHGVQLLAQSFGTSIPDSSMTVSIYTEDPNNPNYPDLTQSLASVASVWPGFGFSPAIANFPQPALCPVGMDVFVGIQLNAASSFGTMIGVLYGTQGSSSFELCGGAMPTSPPDQNSYRLLRQTGANTATYQSRGTYLCDLLTEAPSGAAGAVFIPTVGPGSTSMLSGLYPDASNPPHNNNRADNLSFVYRDYGIAASSPVAYIAAFAGFGPLVPLATLVPGSVGGLCLDQAQLFPLAVGVTNNGYHWVETVVPASVRLVISGTSWTQQAIGFDLATGTLRGTQCVRQQL